VREMFFTNYVNSIRPKIDGSDLIYTSYAPRCHVHLICSPAGKPMINKASVRYIKTMLKEKEKQQLNDFQ
jgi:hypothetical protein